MCDDDCEERDSVFNITKYKGIDKRIKEQIFNCGHYLKEYRTNLLERMEVALDNASFPNVPDNGYLKGFIKDTFSKNNPEEEEEEVDEEEDDDEDETDDDAKIKEQKREEERRKAEEKKEKEKMEQLLKEKEKRRKMEEQKKMKSVPMPASDSKKSGSEDSPSDIREYRLRRFLPPSKARW